MRIIRKRDKLFIFFSCKKLINYFKSFSKIIKFLNFHFLLNLIIFSILLFLFVIKYLKQFILLIIFNNLYKNRIKLKPKNGKKCKIKKEEKTKNLKETANVGAKI
jgi:hypothetical protein